MKQIKLIITFLLILGGVVAAIYFFGGYERRKSDNILDVPLQTYVNKFEEDWNAKSEWDADFFKQKVNHIKQLSREYRDVTVLKDLNTRMAVYLLYTNTFDEWGKERCKKSAIDKYISGIDTITKYDSNAKADASLKKIKDVHKVYVKAYNLSKEKFRLRPNFNGKIWEDYSGYAQKKEASKKSIQNDSIYRKYLNNITDIKNGLDGVTSRLESGRTQFFNDLALEIIDYYDDKPSNERNKGELEQLRSIVIKYNRASRRENFHLKDFYQSYNRDVENNEEQIR